MAFLSDNQIQTLTNEGVDTVTAGMNLVQYAIAAIMQNPLKSAGILALFAVVFGGIKLKLSDLVEIKK